MPDLVGSTLASAGAIAWLVDGQTAVVFPSTEATWSVEATTRAGTFHPAYVGHATFQTETVSLDRGTEATHTIVGQSPPPGTPLSQSTTFSITAGPHPNDTGQPWAGLGHMIAVSRVGAARCLMCHSPKRCADCHIAVHKPGATR